MPHRKKIKKSDYPAHHEKPKPMQYHPETHFSVSHVAHNLKHPEDFFDIVLSKNITLVIDYFLLLCLFWTLGSVAWSLVMLGDYVIGLINGLFMFAGAMLTAIFLSALLWITSKYSHNMLSFNDSFRLTVASLTPVYVFSFLRWFSIATMAVWLMLCFYTGFLLVTGLMKLNFTKQRARLIAVLFIIFFLAMQAFIRGEIISIVLTLLEIKYI